MEIEIKEFTVKYCKIIAEMESEISLNPWNSSQFTLNNGLNRGFVGILPNGDIASYVYLAIVPYDAEILKIGVKPDFRRRGFARKLIEYSVIELRKVGVLRIFLEVEEINIVASSLYKNCGFQITGRRRNYYGNNRDALNMVKSI